MSRASGASKRRTTASSRYPGRRRCSSSESVRLLQRTNTCSHTGRRARCPPYSASTANACQQALLAEERLAGSGVDTNVGQLAGRGEAGEVDDLVVAGAPAPARGGAGGGGFGTAPPRAAPHTR